jgi:hypothetical protein
MFAELFSSYFVCLKMARTGTQVNSNDEDDNNKNKKDNLCDGICLQNPYFHFHFVEPQGSM